MTSYPSLDKFTQPLRDYQQAALDDALEWLETAEPNARILYHSPTGTGKGSLELALLKHLRSDGIDAWILTPKLDILRGYLERCGATEAQLAAGPDKLEELGARIYVATERRACNREVQGRLTPPEVVIYDEVHHAVSVNQTAGLLFAMGGGSRWIGYTATPYRGTAKSTLQLEEDWGEIVEVLSIPDAIEQGWWALPRVSVVPLVDDDRIKVTGGEFQVRASTRAVGSRVGALAELIASVDRALPTAVAVPSREVGAQLVEALDPLGIDAALVHAGTTQPQRWRIYEACRAGELVIVSVAVIAEGWDAPWLRRLIDARPTQSPVRWLQYLGRITRPGPVEPEYICTCRNVERFAYLLGGALPPSVVRQAQEAFDKPSKRGGLRQVGLEALARFKAIPVKLASGVTGHLYILYSVDPNGVTHEWASICDPTRAEPIHAHRSIAPVPDGETSRPRSAYGRWEPTSGIPDLTGFATSRFNGRMSVTQQEWWERAAAARGLDPAVRVTQRVFQVLPILRDLGVKL